MKDLKNNNYKEQKNLSVCICGWKYGFTHQVAGNKYVGYAAHQVALHSLQF